MTNDERRKKSEGRNPKAEGNPKSEIRNKLEDSCTVHGLPFELSSSFAVGSSDFRFRISFEFRISDFGLFPRFSRCATVTESTMEISKMPATTSSEIDVGTST